MLESKPIVPPLPDAEVYGPEALQLFPRYTRATFAAAHNGQQAPPWDPSMPIKRWFDTTHPKDAEVTYTVWNPSTRRPSQVKMLGAEAARLNLPGAFSYAKYTIAPTEAVVLDSFGYPHPLSANQLSSRQDADLLAFQLVQVWNSRNGFPLEANVVEPQYAGSILPIQWNGETRRFWAIELWGGKAFNVGMLLAARHANGINAPGEWLLSQGSNPIWSSQATGDLGAQDVRPESLIPIRPLLENEAVRGTPFGVWIYRTDRPNPVNGNI